jgi:hypothetical protein
LTTTTNVWQICAANGGVRTITTTATAVNNTTTFARLKIVMNGTASAQFYVNEVLVGTITTNLPLTTATGIGIKIEKSAGTGAGSSRSVYADYVHSMCNYSGSGR